MVASVLEVRLKQILREAVDPVLKPLNFRKKGQIYRCQRPAVWWVVGVQRSQWNTAEKLDFTINFGVYVPGFISTWNPNWSEPQAPTVPDCVVHARIGDLNPESHQGLWWVLRLEDEANVVDEGIKREIRAELEGYVVPFFQDFQTKEEVVRLVERIESDKQTIALRGSDREIFIGHLWPGGGPQESVHLGILYWMVGDQEQCCKALERARQKTDSPGYLARVDEIISRLCSTSSSVGEQIP